MSYPLESFREDCPNSVISGQAGGHEIAQNRAKPLSKETYIAKYFEPGEIDSIKFPTHRFDPKAASVLGRAAVSDLVR